MKTVLLKKAVRLKSGEVFEKGTPVKVRVVRERPWNCVLTIKGKDYRLRTANLHHISDDFVKPTEELISMGVMDSVCESMTGARVEPDGWDSEGFPSVLLACGLA